MAKRIQRKRTKGWKMPEGAVSVTRPGKWGNMFRVGQWAKIGVSFGGIFAPYYLVGNKPGDGTGWVYIDCAQTAVAMFRKWLSYSAYAKDIDELRGKDLACFCPLDQPCHADVLLELANEKV